MTTRSALRHALLLAVATFVAGPAHAGGPLANCGSGQPFRWANGGVNIPFNPDQGNLGPLSGAQAVAAVQGAFDTWGAVPSSTASYLAGVALPVDVDITNFEPYLEPAAPDGYSAIVFDDTGEIFDLLFGPNSGILGFAGPEWVNPGTCTILEGVSFLNGPSFDDLEAAIDVMVHEFGHYTNLAHTVVNGQIFLAGDHSGPTPFDTFGAPSSIAVIETMYPFYFGPGSGTQTLHADDIATVSALYPEAGFASATGTIAGSILAPNGATRVSGINVIARNVANPFEDAVSALSGDATDGTTQADPLVGTYRLPGLTPGATYAVYVDSILQGGFSTPPASLPGPEEFYSGAGESNNVSSPDDPSTFQGIVVGMGATASGVDVIFNTFVPGDLLPVGDDGFVELFPPFTFSLCGQEFASVFVNGNGSLTFGGPSADFSETPFEFLNGLPRIAGLWDDLNPDGGGTVTFGQNANSFTVTFEGIPEYPAVGANTFSITLKRSANQASIDYGGVSAVDGLAGISCGGAVTTSFEHEVNLRGRGRRATFNMNRETAVYEFFSASDNDLANAEITFVNLKRGFDDAFEPNDSLATARRVSLPFSTDGLRSFSEIDPAGGDIDYYRFSAKAGDILAIEVVRAQLGVFDGLIGLFNADNGQLLAVDDDGGFGGLGGLSRLLVQVGADLNLAVAVTTYPDVGFTGAGGPGGRYVLTVNRYRGTVLPAGDDTATEVPLGFGFRYQGQTWNSVFVNSNGNLTFGAGDEDFSESVPELLAGPPRIAPLWDDLDATDGLVIAEPGPFSMNIHFVSVPEFFSTSPNYFSVSLLPFGFYGVQWGATAGSDALAGITEGNGAPDPGASNLSAIFPVQSGRGTRYERFLANEFDLSFRELLFVPFF